MSNHLLVKTSPPREGKMKGLSKRRDSNSRLDFTLMTDYESAVDDRSTTLGYKITQT